MSRWVVVGCLVVAILWTVGTVCAGEYRCPCTDPSFTHRENIDGKDGDDVLLEIETDGKGHRVELWCMNTNSTGAPAPAFGWFVVRQVGGQTVREKVGQCHFPRGRNVSKKTLNGQSVFPKKVTRDNEGVYVIEYDEFNDGEWLSWNPDRNSDGKHDDYHYRWNLEDSTTKVEVKQTENMRTLASAVVDPVAPGEILAICDISNYLEMPRDETDVMLAAVFDETEAEMYDELLAMYMAAARALQQTRLAVSFEALWTDYSELPLVTGCLAEGYVSELTLGAGSFSGVAVHSTLPSDGLCSVWAEAGLLCGNVTYGGLITGPFDLDVEVAAETPVTGTLPAKLARIGGGVRLHTPWNFDPFTPYLELGAGAVFVSSSVTLLDIPDLAGATDALVYWEPVTDCYLGCSLGTCVGLRAIPNLEATVVVNGFLVGRPGGPMQLQYGGAIGICYRF